MAAFYYNDGKEVECDDLHRVFKDGALEMETPYVDGKIHGIMRCYFDTGEIDIEISMIKGVKQGYSRSYHRSGLISEESLYEKGKLVYSTTYDHKGDIIEKVTY